MVELTSYKCPDCPFGGPKVGHIGNPKARAVLVGESPGRREVRAKPTPRPFIGDSGELLWDTLPGGEDLDYWYVTNALWCSPRKKKDEATLNTGCRLCHDRLIEEMTEHPRDIIVAMGNAAVRSLTNNFGIKITKARGRPIPSELAKYGIMPVVHPAALLRGTGTYRQFQQDLRHAYELSQGAPPREPVKPWHCIIDTDAGAKWLVEQVLEQVRGQGTLELGADIETTGFDRRHDEILCLGISWDPRRVHMVAAKQIHILKLLFADDRIVWCWHNGKFDSAFLVRDGLPARVDEDTMLMSYCLAPKTRVLKTDMTWKPIGEIRVGEELVGFDEYGPDRREPTKRELQQWGSKPWGRNGPYPGKSFKPTKVTAVKRLKTPCYKITTSYGSIICSENHMWVASYYGQRWRRWVPTKILAEKALGGSTSNNRTGSKVELFLFVQPWEVDTSHKGGYIAGVLDGEGCLSGGWKGKDGTSNWVLSFSQNPGKVLDEMLEALKSKGYDTNLYKYDKKSTTQVSFRGYRESLRVIGRFRPVRFLDKVDKVWRGTRKCEPVPILAIEFIGDQEVVGIETTTKTLIAEGFLSHNCLEELPGVHDLEQVAKDVVNASDYKYMIQPFLPNKNSSYALIPKPVLYEYGSYDVSNTLQIKHHLRKQVNEDPRDKKLYEELLLPASDFLRKVEWRGIKVDPLRINSLDIVFGDELELLKEKLYEIVGRPFNANSWQQVAEILYVQYELKSRHKDTRKDTLEKLLPHVFVEAMLRYRKVAKAHGTYVKGVRRETSDDGRIHTTFKIHGTRTGRLSSAEPNMQNIPRDSKTRGMFVAEDEKVFIELDLNQAELRSLACLSGDKILCDIYNSTDRSLHNETAIMIFGEDYDSEDKMKAKTVNFGIVYGRTAGSLAEHFEISLREAQRWIDGWANGYPEAWMFIRKCRTAPRKLLTMWTSFGRKKRHRLVTRELLWNMMNEAANFPHQSIASDINLLSGIKCDDYLEQEFNALIVNLIHDALLIETPADWTIIDGVIRYVAGVMESLPPKYGLTAVPFKAEAKVGFRWGKQYMHDYKPGDPHPIRLRKEPESDILRVAA